jgi:H+-translocating NAD(P) transhydrogenase subunit alpha
VPFHASQMYAKNITTFLRHLLTKDGTMAWDLSDEITRETLVTHKGDVVHDRVRGLVMAKA